MRDLIAGLVAVMLLIAAVRLAAALAGYRRQRQMEHDALRASGRRVIAELPVAAGLAIISEDEGCFYGGERAIDKNLIRAVRVLINGSPMAGYVSRRFPVVAAQQTASFDDPVEGIARDRWDVMIETTTETVLIECGAIRERVSQELARRVFEAVKADLEHRDSKAQGP